MGSRARRALAICVLALGLHLCGPFGFSARAADWSVTSGLSSTIIIDDNLSLEPDPLGAVGFVNSATINITALKPTASFSLSSGASHSIYVGPGAPSDLGGFSPNLSAALQKSDKLTTYGLTASVSARPTAEIELEEDEEIRTSGQTISYAVGATIARPLGPRDSLSGALAWSSASADESDRESSSFSLSGSWSHQISDLTSIGASVSRSQSSSADDDEDTVVWGFNGSFGTSLSPRLSLSASAGFSVIDGPGAADLFDEVVVDDGPTISGPTMSAALTYALKTTTFSLTASNAISETTFGDLRESRSFGFSVAQAVNSRANLVLTGSHRTSRGGGLESGERTSRSLSLVYSHAITPYWNGSLTYRYRDVDRADGFARSNAGYFSLSRSLTLVP